MSSSLEELRPGSGNFERLGQPFFKGPGRRNGYCGTSSLLQRQGDLSFDPDGKQMASFFVGYDGGRAMCMKLPLAKLGTWE